MIMCSNIHYSLIESTHSHVVATHTLHALLLVACIAKRVDKQSIQTTKSSRCVIMCSNVASMFQLYDLRDVITFDSTSFSAQ